MAGKDDYVALCCGSIMGRRLIATRQTHISNWALLDVWVTAVLLATSRELQRVEQANDSRERRVMVEGGQKRCVRRRQGGMKAESWKRAEG